MMTGNFCAEKMRLVCGPMATISHPAFRILIEKFGGCDEYFTEMINAGSLLNDGPFEKFYVNPEPVPQKIVWQLTGNDAPRMAEAARRLVEYPGLGLDINMGCSAPDIYRTGAGIGWMLCPIEKTRQMIRDVASVVSGHNRLSPGFEKRFSVKLRLGDDDFTPDGFLAFCDMLVEEGVRLLTLHPRTKKEKLSRPPRYEWCQALAQRYAHADSSGGVTVYLNGNVRDAQSAANAADLCPMCGGIMISRAAVQKPWIFKEIREAGGSSEQKNQDGACRADDAGGAIKKNQSVDMLALCLEYIDLVEKYQPEAFYRSRLQRFFTYFCDNFKFAHYARTQFLNARDDSDLRLRIAEFFDKCPEERMRQGP